jgi:hypothetical protein
VKWCTVFRDAWKDLKTPAIDDLPFELEKGALSTLLRAGGKPMGMAAGLRTTATAPGPTFVVQKKKGAKARQRRLKKATNTHVEGVNLNVGTQAGTARPQRYLSKRRLSHSRLQAVTPASCCTPFASSHCTVMHRLSSSFSTCSPMASIAGCRLSSTPAVGLQRASISARSIFSPLTRDAPLGDGSGLLVALDDADVDELFDRPRCINRDHADDRLPLGIVGLLASAGVGAALGTTGEGADSGAAGPWEVRRRRRSRVRCSPVSAQASLFSPLTVIVGRQT